jgi:hypothetical protein
MKARQVACLISELHYSFLIFFLALGVTNVGYEIITAKVVKGTIFWATTPCSPLKINRRFGGNVRLPPVSYWFLALGEPCFNKYKYPD